MSAPFQQHASHRDGHEVIGVDVNPLKVKTVGLAEMNPDLVGVQAGRSAAKMGMNMRILVEPGCYDSLNMGDVAMLQVLVHRLSNLWPKATIQVLTDDPERLLDYCPNVEPIDALGRRIWFQDGGLFSPLHKLLPETLSSALLEIEGRVRRSSPANFERFLRFKKRLLRQDCASLTNFLRAVDEAALVVVSGQGSINDSFYAQGLNLLDVLGMAIRRGTPAALFGQGIGPIANRRLRTRVKQILPLVTGLAMREGRAGLPLLDSLKVDRSSVLITGDDAIELAYNARANELGEAIGLNIRVSGYSNMDDSLLEKVGAVLWRVSKKHEAPLVPVPIAINEEVSDVRSFRRLVKECKHPYESEASLLTPMEVITQISTCRIVVAGSYHAAVFALAQGIPTVCLANSAYYLDKFLGLANQFGVGCKVITDGAQISENLEAALEDSWRQAESTRRPLLEAAARQIEAGRDAYYQFYQQITSKRM